MADLPSLARNHIRQTFTVDPATSTVDNAAIRIMINWLIAYDQVTLDHFTLICELITALPPATARDARYPLLTQFERLLRHVEQPMMALVLLKQTMNVAFAAGFADKFINQQLALNPHTPWHVIQQLYKDGQRQFHWEFLSIRGLPGAQFCSDSTTHYPDTLDTQRYIPDKVFQHLISCHPIILINAQCGQLTKNKLRPYGLPTLSRYMNVSVHSVMPTDVPRGQYGRADNAFDAFMWDMQNTTFPDTGIPMFSTAWHTLMEMITTIVRTTPDGCTMKCTRSVFTTLASSSVDRDKFLRYVFPLIKTPFTVREYHEHLQFIEATYTKCGMVGVDDWHHRAVSPREMFKTMYLHDCQHNYAAGTFALIVFMCDGFVTLDELLSLQNTVGLC